MLFKKLKAKRLFADKTGQDKIWELYASGELKKLSPEADAVCAYESGVNGDGHSGFFFNNEEDMTGCIDILKTVLPSGLYENLYRAWKAYNTENEETICDEADDYFYEHEQEIIDIVYKYSKLFG